MLLVRIYRQIRPLLRYVTAAVCVLAIGVQIDAAQIGLINDFSDGVQGWEGSGLVQVANGGPDGEGDGYLRITADGGFGPGGKIAAYNQSSDVRGDLGALDVIAIDVDMFVDPSSQSDLTMRLVLFGPTNTNNRWTSTDAITVPKDGQWHHLSFPVAADAITRAQGAATYEQMISDVVRIMFRHDAGTPSSQGTVVSAIAGIDNVFFVVPDVPPMFDFDGSGALDVGDIDALLLAVRTGSTDSQYDVDADGGVNVADIVALVTAPSGFNTYIGDVNLDGEFNTSDLVQIFQAGQYEDATQDNSTWESGDWDGDGDFGTGDLLLAFQQGGFEQPARASVAGVPEPASSSLFVLGSLMLIGRRRLCR